jgi:hypothetical protein
MKGAAGSEKCGDTGPEAARLHRYARRSGSSVNVSWSETREFGEFYDRNHEATESLSGSEGIERRHGISPRLVALWPRYSTGLGVSTE